LTLDVKKSNSSNETPNVMTVGVENYGLSRRDNKVQMIRPLVYGSRVRSGRIFSLVATSLLEEMSTQLPWDFNLVILTALPPNTEIQEGHYHATKMGQ
jgi:hypothetical protein